MNKEIKPTQPGYEHTDIAQLTKNNMIVEPELNSFIDSLAVVDKTPKVPSGHIGVDNTMAAMQSAFQFGYLCAEKGMNMEAAVEHFRAVMRA